MVSQIAGWLNEHSFYLRLLAIGGAVSVAAFLIVLLVRFFAARQHRLPPAALAASPEGPAPPPPDPGLLAELEAAGDWSRAVVLLHRLSVAHLAARGLLPAKNLTNDAIAVRLSDGTLRAIFRAIAVVSERVLFDRAEASEDDYARCRNEYRRAFRDGRP
ncbi:MAG: DUF4129 domain-containing protein [Spirochaetales bacterium]|nr:DUF4129 domain-containing protein [Spirochaetales bacterium]